MSASAPVPAATNVAPRGFAIDRSHGRPLRPGSLHTNPRLSQWLSLAEPGVVRVFTGKVELGQGILTALQLIVADELDLPLAAVRIVAASTTRGPDEGVTSGSLSVQDSGGALRHACAELRGLALQQAGQRAGVAAASIRVDSGCFHSADGALLSDYWTLLSDVDLEVAYEGRWAPKTAAQRRLIGQARPPRLDLADKVFGQARFIHDLRLPGMLHGRVLRAPTLDATLSIWPPDGLGEMPTGVRCWADGRFIAVIAPSERQADAIAQRLRGLLAW